MTDDKIIKPRQTMIVVWKWRHLPDHVNQHIIKNKYKDKLPSIEESKGRFYAEHNVEWSESCPNAHFISASIYKDGPKTQELLDQLIERYMPETNDYNDKSQLMLFLHRNNGYKEKDIERLLEKYNDRIFKIFLFADQRDYIYYGSQRSGLLDNSGGFDYGKDPKSEAKFTVYDRKTNTVKQPFFDRVWRYYSNEFESKVYRLKEDLYDCWFPLLLPDQPKEIKREKWIELITETEEGFLWYRLKSFLDKYDKIEEKNPDNFEIKSTKGEEVDLIMAKEKEKGQSFLFDDCIANLKQQRLKQHTFISEEYDGICEDFQKTLLNEERTIINVKEMIKIAEKMNYLVKIIPGVMD